MFWQKFNISLIKRKFDALFESVKKIPPYNFMSFLERI